MNYNRLETSLIDVIKEEQAKLGYMKEKISLYYPLSSRRRGWRWNKSPAINNKSTGFSRIPAITRRKVSQISSSRLLLHGQPLSGTAPRCTSARWINLMPISLSITFLISADCSAASMLPQYWYQSNYKSQFLTVLGNGITSRMLPMPVRYITQRSNPRPNPEWRVEPYLRRPR